MEKQIIQLVQLNKIQEARLLFAQHIRKTNQMNQIVYSTFQTNNDNVGKQIIGFNFVINNQGFKYNYSPFDFFCFVCKNEYLDILFKIIEDSYFWNKDKVIFEPEFQQTPRQWLIATAGYILCSLNKIKSLEILCVKYNITKFDAEQTKFFEIASEKNYDDLLEFLINRYGNLTTEEYESNPQTKFQSYSQFICESSLYDVSKLSIDNPMYIEMKSQSKSEDVTYAEISPPNISRLNKPKENITCIVTDDKPPEISRLNKPSEMTEMTKVIELSVGNPMYMYLSHDNQ